MNPQQERKFDEKFNLILEKQDEMQTSLTQMETTIFGARGNGGMLNEQETMKKDIDDLKHLKWKLTGITLGITAVVSILWKVLVG